MPYLSEPSHKKIEINLSVFGSIFGCLFPHSQSAGSYFAMFLFAEFYCTLFIQAGAGSF